MANRWHIKAWQVLYVVGLPTMGVSAYMLHEAIWPGKGIFLDLIMESANPASPRVPLENQPGDFSRVGTVEYWLLYYIPFAIGALFMAVGWYQRHTTPVPQHVTYDQMEE